MTQWHGWPRMPHPQPSGYPHAFGNTHPHFLWQAGFHEIHGENPQYSCLCRDRILTVIFISLGMQLTYLTSLQPEAIYSRISWTMWFCIILWCGEWVDERNPKVYHPLPGEQQVFERCDSQNLECMFLMKERSCITHLQIVLLHYSRDGNGKVEPVNSSAIFNTSASPSFPLNRLFCANFYFINFIILFCRP